MKKTVFLIVVPAAVAVFLIMGGYRLVGSGIARFTSDFKVLPSDNRILYEDGAEALAKEAARYLPQAIAAVESKQHGSFRGPVKVYAFATSKSFSKFSGVSEAPVAAGLKNEVYLSGKLLTEMNKVQGILAHELSHVQLSQTLGTIRFNRTLPRWFREGLAIYVADGGGATNASEAETIEQFLQGKHFAPETEGALFNLKLPGPKGLEPKIFYRQSGMFVRFIARSYPVRFEAFVKGLQEGRDFESHFIKCFRCNVSTMLQAFTGTLKRK